VLWPSGTNFKIQKNPEDSKKEQQNCNYTQINLLAYLCIDSAAGVFAAKRIFG
jgi:hypothetical protein